jgi:hypothetical protein
MTFGEVEKPLVETIGFLEQAVRLDPKFALAYCASAEAHSLLYTLYDPTPEQRALGEAAVDTALGLEPDQPEVHRAYAFHLYQVYRGTAGDRAARSAERLRGDRARGLHGSTAGSIRKSNPRVQ